MGATSSHGIKLTSKQKAFAQKVAEGKPKAQAYREAYDSQGKPATQSNEGHKLAQNPAIATMIEAFRLANEAREYLLPEQMRTLAIQKLVEITTTQEEKTANKLKAIELIGKMSEVSLFNETKTHLHIHSSTDLKAKLLEGLRLAFISSRSLNNEAKIKAESLLAELNNPITIDAPAYEVAEPATPPTPTPLESGFTRSESLHSIPHNESTPPIISGSPTKADDINNPIGDRDIDSLLADLESPSETPPLSK